MSGTGYSYQYLIVIVILLYSNNLLGQVTFVIDNLPENTPETDTIYISGNFEGWTGGQHNYALKSVKGKHFFTLPKASTKTLEFKFTRGSWATVEVDENGVQIDNRTYSFSEQHDSLHLSISNWHDLSTSIGTASVNVHLLSEEFDMKPLNKKRRVWIYLPDNYADSTKKYPVLYMHDGQNLFDKTLAYSGEWGVDETLDKLNDSLGLELIVVAVDHGGKERIDELSPWDIKNYPNKVEGDLYVKFITENLKPYVDQHYRTLRETDHTAIMGSSLGGLISFYAAITYPNVYGKAGVFSPSFPLVNEEIEIPQNNPELKKLKLYFMSGDLEGSDMVQQMNQMSAKMIRSGIPEKNIETRVVKDGKHNEKLWNEEFESAIIWLFKN